MSRNILLAFDKGLQDLRVKIKWFIQDLFIGSNYLATHGSISCKKVGHHSCRKDTFISTLIMFQFLVNGFHKPIGLSGLILL